MGQDLRAWLEAYIDAFNRNDFEGFGAYYAEDVEFRGQAASLNGRQAVLDFYRGVKARIKETITIRQVVVGDDRIGAEIETRLEAMEDWPDFPTGPFRKGDKRGSINFILYEIENGKFARIRSARFGTLSE